ncbi:MAG: ribonuclease R [Proteobacteria bacterium]|nr:ribonuclease R [Pseudomonadota bacterium]
MLDFLRESGRPLKAEEIFGEFGLGGQKVRSQLLEKLRSMVSAGQIIENRRGEFCLIERLNLVTGKVSGHRDGFGFVARDDLGDDIYLSAREMRSLFDGDRVAIKITGEDRRGRPEGKLVEVLERGVREIAGQFIRERGIGVVIPDNPKVSHRVLIAKGAAGNAKHGQIVVVRILDYPTHVEQATGEIVRIIGHPDDKGIATDIAIQSHAIPTDWPRAVVEQAETFGANVPSAAKKNRVDLRDTNLMTIDGADARDFDDAVFCEPSGKGFRVLVAIADVAHYVEQGTPLDKQAIRRGTSVYFPDRVVPMLPEALSNGLCSLNPKVDRLCLVCEMRVEPDGKVSKSKFFEAVMRSAARLTYSEVGDFFTGETKDHIPLELRKNLEHLHEVYQAFATNRRKRGAVELDIPQTQIEMGKNGSVRSIKAVIRNDAHRLIEECMIAANVQAAKFLRANKIPGLYRVHAKPNPDRFDDLRLYLVSLGLKVPHPDHIQPRDFSRMIDQVRDRPDSAAISMAMLRSMSHAEYTPKNIGHFGLALDAYAHFTSPIRRYPDLLVHRAIRHIVRGGKAGNYGYDGSLMEHLGSVCSAHERRAEEATREVEGWLKCQYMEDKVGEQFPGVITGVTSFGAFVQIPELQIDGLVHVTSLASDYYQFDAGSQSLIGQRTGKRYRLGDQLEIVVAKVDLDTKRIDFNLVEESRGHQSPRRRKKSKR